MKRRMPNGNEKRIIRRFLFKPLAIDKQWRWLEVAYIMQIWKSINFEYRWKNVGFTIKENWKVWKEEQVHIDPCEKLSPF